MQSTVLYSGTILCFWLAAGPIGFAADDPSPLPPIPRLLPPEGIEIPADVRQRLEARLAASKERLAAVQDRVYRADVEIFTKAVELALLHREFYSEKDFAKADWALDQADERLASAAANKAPWERKTGLVVQGYRSEIDDSAQPYGLVIPADHDFGKQCPLYVWLHGRGDKNTDLHFLQERATKVGQITPPGAIVLHPFGRHCVGFKHAGEIDVFESIASVKRRYAIDDDRVVLIGFSMGGAGAWHIGAHYADRFVAVSPGAGFAETARYQNLTPEKYPPPYEQKLWGQYDVPNYVRNLFNTTVIAYSGENDKQIQAARVMEEAYRAEGRELTHLIGPGVEHKYEPKTLEELLRQVEVAVAAGRPKTPKTVHLQTRTLAYPRMHWVTLQELQEHWQDSRVDAEIVGEKQIRATTKNVTSVRLKPWPKMEGTAIEIDGQSVTIPATYTGSLFLDGGKWKAGWRGLGREGKSFVHRGPIDDAFRSRFLVVTPTGKSRNGRFQQWVEFELQHLRRRWRALMRGDLPEVRDVDLAEDPSDMYHTRNWVLFGDADSNSVLRRVQAGLPARSHEGQWEFGSHKWNGDRYVPALIFSYREANKPRYIVLNSGLTFREGHDRTNSLQNPKLPDWAVIDMSQPPDAFSPGRIHDAGFFDGQWQLKNQPRAP
jgi:dienelactone hydrolase